MPVGGKQRSRPAPPAALTKGRRVALIDIGSNAIRLLAVQLHDATSWTVLHEDRAPARLAQGQGIQTHKAHRVLSAEAMGRGLDAMTHFRSSADALDCEVFAFATAAVRDAENREEFLSLLFAKTRIRVELLPPGEEGRCAFRGVARTLDLSHGVNAVVDIGGGSLQYIVSHRGVITQNISLPLGAVRLTERFGGAQSSSGRRFDELCEYVRDQIARALPTLPDAPAMLIGSGGTFSTLQALASASVRSGKRESANPASARANGKSISLSTLRGWIEKLRGMTVAERMKLPGMPGDRADIAAAGFAVAERIMKHLRIKSVTPCSGGMREGLLMRIASRSFEPRGKPDHASLLRSVRLLAGKAHSPRKHSEHVAALAIRIYEQCLAAKVLGPRAGAHDLLFLEAGAVLHDTGMLVSYAGHHRHGERIVRNAEIAGWDDASRDLLALIVRYHRKAIPDVKHARFAALSKPERALVRRVVGVLRIADGLDRSHAHAVLDVVMHATKDRIVFRVVFRGEHAKSHEQELLGAKAKRGLFEKLTNAKAVFNPGQSPPGTLRPRSATHTTTRT